MSKLFFRYSSVIRILIVSMALFTSVSVFADGWTPSDAGLVVDLQRGDRILLSVMVDDDNEPSTPDKEYFVCHYPSQTGGHFNYSAGDYLKLLPQENGATEPSDVSIWTIDDALTRIIDRKNYALGGISYTMKSKSGYTLWVRPEDKDLFKFLGYLTNSADTTDNKCDVVFVYPTDNARTISFDPENTLGRAAAKREKFNGEKGIGFAGMPYREVYWLEIPRLNGPIAYTNAAVVTFNTTTTNKSWRPGTILPGWAAYAYADNNSHKNTTRTIFRLYVLNRPLDHCPDSYYFGTDKQSLIRYRKTNTLINPKDDVDYTSWRKVYTLDWLNCMDRVGETSFFRTDYMRVPESDSTFYYVGKKDKYVNKTEADTTAWLNRACADTGAVSQFKAISLLRPYGLQKDIAADTVSKLMAPKGAYGRMQVDTTSCEQNLDVSFLPVGYFLQTNSGLNVRLIPNEDYTVWTTEQMWHITAEDTKLQIKATLISGEDFSTTDPGLDITGWSKMVNGLDIPVHGNPEATVVDQYGWARIYTDNSAKALSYNGGLELVLIDNTKYIQYDNNGHFGEDIPNQYASVEDATVIVQEPRLLAGYKFTKWTTNADGTGDSYYPGDEITLDSGSVPSVLHLYAQAKYEGIINVAISFVHEDGKRYFLTQPGEAPRYARARHFDDWTHVWQGMANAENSDPNYLSSYTILGKEEICKECEPGEYVLDPRYETMHGNVDSLTYYEKFHPQEDVYIGLYYTNPYTILANNTWAGLFRSSNGWPTPSNPCVDSTIISSSHYLTTVVNDTTRLPRGGAVINSPSTLYADSALVYNATDNQFDGDIIANGTNFMISGIGVVDAHYVILPDTTDEDAEWVDEITFGYHENQTTEQQIWSKLIGKQLLAQMMVGNEIVYFHPNSDKTITTADELRLSLDYRLAQSFTYIQDSREGGSMDTLTAAFRPSIRNTSNGFCQILTSGISSPKEIKVRVGEELVYDDIYDTIRVRLTPRGTSKVKAYYGRWKTGSPGLHVAADGSRYRDIIVRTKTYHYGAASTRLKLKPENASYTFSPLKDQSQDLNFKLWEYTVYPLLDLKGVKVGEVITDSTEVTDTKLGMIVGGCSLKGSYFDVTGALYQHVTLKTKVQNNEMANRDTLVISSINYNGSAYDIDDIYVPLVQASLAADELIWSVVDGTTRYFIVASSEGNGLTYRTFTKTDSRLYKQGTKTELLVGSKNADNDDNQYITPWKFRYTPNPAVQTDQLLLTTDYGVGRSFRISGSTPGTVPTASADTATLTYRYVDTYVNDNANYEEHVRIYFADKGWLMFRVTGSPATPELYLDNTDTVTEEEATVFSWGYLKKEFNIYEKGTYPSQNSAEFRYNSSTTATITTKYKAFYQYSMLLNNTLTYLARKDEENIGTLKTDPWYVDYEYSLIPDARFIDKEDASKSRYSGLEIKGLIDESKMQTKIGPKTDSVTSPKHVRYPLETGPYVDIVDTFDFKVKFLPGAPTYGFTNTWKDFKSIEDAHLKIPMIRKTYHVVEYDSLSCTPDRDEYSHVFSATDMGATHTFTLHTVYKEGSQILNIDNQIVDVSAATSTDMTAEGSGGGHAWSGMDLSNINMTEIRLIDESGGTPTWCEISGKTANTITVRCKENGIRAPRNAYLYFAYIVYVDSKMKFVNFQLRVTQTSIYEHADNQTLVHSSGASGDPKLDGIQQVHENKRILYYYPDQYVELPIRERNFYGWWRWYQEVNEGGVIMGRDVPDADWQDPPTNSSTAYTFAFNTIGDAPNTMGRYTVFHYPSQNYGKEIRKNPPANSPRLKSTVLTGKRTYTYAADISNYYDNLPLSMSSINNVDVEALAQQQQIIEPTLSLREKFELHPWTEMAAKMEGYKSAVAATYEDESYMEDHVMMAPAGNSLLLTTEQRYNLENLRAGSHSESLLCYYMRDDNWDVWDGDVDRQDTMIWCGGWDATCQWYTYNPGDKRYTECNYEVTKDDDFLSVPPFTIANGKETDSVIYCLRARSKKSVFSGTGAGATLTIDGADGDYWFNICRYKIIYHRPTKYGPLEENNGKAIITNEEIDQSYEVLERLNFDYDKPGPDYRIYPHPLPWTDASYGYCYPLAPGLPQNRYHVQSDFPNSGEYAIINRIPNKSHWPSNLTYWCEMEQHGGAENGYMIYCDGMSSAGQVAALSIDTTLCTGQKIYFSAYVGNPSTVTTATASKPNFIFSVQGSDDGSTWVDITSYMTGEIQRSNKWSQIFFPIQSNKDYKKYRVRIFNVASNWDGNDFVIDDMCFFATKSPMIAYQANTTCKDPESAETAAHAVIRLDYQGFDGFGSSTVNVYYNIEEKGVNSKYYKFIVPVDGYINQRIEDGDDPQRLKYGIIEMPAHTYVPVDDELIFDNVEDLVDKFEKSKLGDVYSFRQGYIFENLDDSIRPVLYIVHKVNVNPDSIYTVRMALTTLELSNRNPDYSCAMTSVLDISNQMVLDVAGNEYENMTVTRLCPNVPLDISMKAKGMLNMDGSAPIEQTGTSICDWLLHGETRAAESLALYGYTYSDIVKSINVLRSKDASNSNRFAKSFTEISSSVMDVLEAGLPEDDEIESDSSAYTIIKHLVNENYLTLYKQTITTSIESNTTLKYVVMPVEGTGWDAAHSLEMAVCPNPIQISLTTLPKSAAPLVINGPSTPGQPVVFMKSVTAANGTITIPISTINALSAVHSVEFYSTDDPRYFTGGHSLSFTPDKTIESSPYYVPGDDIVLTPASSNNYTMRGGYNYTFNIVMQTRAGALVDVDGCPVGNIPFTISVVPDYLRWEPKSAENNSWNNPDNWIGINQLNAAIHDNAHYAPLASTNVVIPAMADGLPYPVLTAAGDPSAVGFVYNTCNSVRFMPGTAIAQQQRLTYDSVVVDMTTPQMKWALRSTPVTGLLSGDIFLSNAELNWEKSPWEVGEFDADGRNYTTGNASFWLSLFSREYKYIGNKDQDKDSTYTANADWSKVANGLNDSLPVAQGWAIFTYTKALRDANVRLPKNDDIYYYYTASGDKVPDLYVNNLRALRNTLSGGEGKAGKLAFHPDGDTKNYLITKGAESVSYVFGNPTMGYIDIWGFIADNSSKLANEIKYIDNTGVFTPAIEAASGEDVITNQNRYLPPMHAMVIKAKATGSSISLTLNANRIITQVNQVVRPEGAPQRNMDMGLSKGIMTITAINPVSNRCTSRLMLGQGYHADIREGEDVVLTTINIDHYSTTNAPATPFNIYASEAGYGLSIDLRDEIVNVPISFLMTSLPYAPTTRLWFTGVNTIEGPLVLYDALTDTERLIRDGSYLDIETPEQSNEQRYYIRRYGYSPGDPSNPTTEVINPSVNNETQVTKILKNGHVFILRNGHVYSMFGQKLR